MTEDLIRLRLFFVSYVPLWAMLVFRAAPPHAWKVNGRTLAMALFGLMALWGIVDAVRLIRGARATGSRSLYFGDISDQGGNAAGYLATYLLPFIGLVPADWGDWTAYGIYFIVAAVVFIRTDLTFVNPTLYVLRHRVVSARAYLTEDRTPDQAISSTPFVVVCRNPEALSAGRVDVASLAGGFVTKREPDISSHHKPN